jgi:hypothetical protein
MNVLMVVLLGWMCVGLETGLKQTLMVRMITEAAPSFVVPLVVVIALCAPPLQTLWACLALGLMLDLTAPLNLAAGGQGLVYVMGPHAVGLALGAQFVLAVRGVVIRRNPISVVVLSMGAAAISGIVVTAMLTARHLYDPIAWNPTSQLMSQLFSAVLTGGTAFAMSFVLLPLSPMLGLLASPRPWGRR